MDPKLQDRLIDDLIRREGGYINHPSDRGGPTKYGITQAVARENGYTGPMVDLPIRVARRIYKRRYWDTVALDSIPHDELRLNLFDFCVHSGPARPGKALQRSLNVLNQRGRHYPDIRVDGAIGPATIGAMKALVNRRGLVAYDVLAHMVGGIRQEFLIGLAERAENQEDFSWGWALRVFMLTEEAE